MRNRFLALIGMTLGALLALGALCGRQAAEMLVARDQRTAIDLARLYAGAVQDRLVAAELALRQRAEALAAGDPGTRGEIAPAAPYFESIAWVAESAAPPQGNGIQQRLAELPTAEQLQSAPDASFLLRAKESASGLALARRGPAGTRGLLVARLDRDYLWGTRQAGQFARNTCVLFELDTPVYCSRAWLAEPAGRQILNARSARAGSFPADSGAAAQVGGYAQIALHPPFYPVAITAVEFAQASEVREAAESFAWQLAPWLLLPLVAFALGAVAVLRPARPDAGGPKEDAGSNQAAGNSQETDRRSAAPATSPSPNDRELYALAVLSEIDRAILSHAQFDRVIDLVLQAAPWSLGCEHAAITMMDHQAGSQAKTFVIASAAGKDRALASSRIDNVDLRPLSNDPGGQLINARSAPPFLKPLAECGAEQFLLVPIYLDAGVAGMLAVSLGAGVAPDPTARSLARDFADRLGVAITAAARERDLYHEANFDPVTSLPNQRLLRERLAQEIARAQRESREFALMYADLDQFRKVNNSAGHLGGDTVLEQAARRMRHCLREEDVIARFSGDEFVVLLPALSKGTSAARVADKLIAVLAEPFVIGTDEHYLSASIGISVFPQDGRSAEKLLRNANFAMYRAKTAGRGQCAFFDERMNSQALERAGLERDLRAAVANGGLTLAFQPQVDLRTGKIIAAEALARWHHPQRGQIPPAVFIEVAEQCNLIEAIGKFVREAACTQYRAWQERELPLARIAVNVSSREIVRRGGFVDHVRSVLAAQGMRPHSLELEITESLLLDQSEEVIRTLRDLHETGVRLAIDDFGTGYSSMAYLKSLPFQILKIDRLFVKDLGTQDGSEGVVNAILGVARSLGKDVVAEGVETEAQRAFLTGEGCNLGQGFLWSRPLPADQFELLMRNWVAVPQPPTLVHFTPRIATA